MFLSEKISEEFFKIQQILKPDICIEVGAYDAEFSQMMANTTKEVYAFEANPRVYEKFKEGLTNINYIHKAISDKDENISFYIQDRPEEWAEGSNSIKHRTDGAKIGEIVSVEAASLDSIFKNQSGSVCLWVDCEGANEQVLKGATNLLNSVESIFIEVELVDQWENSWQMRDVEDYLSNFDFVLIKHDLFWYGQANCIFVKRSSLNNDIFKVFHTDNLV